MNVVVNWSTAAILGAGLIVVPEAAGAFGLDRWDPTQAPEHPRIERFINHYVYKPRYTHVYHTAPQADPYAYRYAPRAYYPYYGSRYWVPAEHMRNRYRYEWSGPKYQYRPSWGRKSADHVSAEQMRPTK